MTEPSRGPTGRMTADAFIEWSMAQPSGRWELVDGEVVGMAAERAAHARVKGEAFVALRDAVRAQGLQFEAFPDGMAVQVSDDVVYEPDASVRCGPPLDDEATSFSDPVIVVEVVSPSSRAVDTGVKLEGYFRLPSLTHYLIVRTDSRAVIHHRRGADGAIATAILREGALTLDPPGLRVELAAFFARR